MYSFVEFELLKKWLVLPLLTCRFLTFANIIPEISILTWLCQFLVPPVQRTKTNLAVIINSSHVIKYLFVYKMNTFFTRPLPKFI